MIIGQNGNAKTHGARIVQQEFISKLTSRLVIIPAAGLGTRMGSPPAKELLQYPLYPMSFLEKALERVQEINAVPLVVSRVDKVVLNEWLMEHEIPHAAVTPTSEWVETVMLSQPFWQEKNLLLLPDTEFSPASSLQDLLSLLEESQLVAGVFRVNDLSSWGGFKKSQGTCWVAEKLSQPEAGLAWGVIGFRREVAENFWHHYLKAQQTKNWVELPQTVQWLELEKFEDLTRGS